MRALLSAIKYRALSSIPQKYYWGLMGRFQPVRAVTSQFTKLEDSLQSGEAVVAMLEKVVSIHKGVRVLQIGSGIGRIELHLHKKVAFCYGVDISSTMVERAEDNVPAENVRFICSDSLSGLNIQDVDFIFSIFVFQHLPRWRTVRYIQEAYSKLAHGGGLVFQILVDETESMPEPRKNHPYGLRYYSRNDLRGLLESAGFADIRFLAFPTAGEDAGGTGDLLVVASRPKAPLPPRRDSAMAVGTGGLAG